MLKHASEIVGLSWMDRLSGKLKNHSDVLHFIGLAGSTLLLSCSVLFGQIAPFGVAMCAAASGEFAMAPVLGAVAGYLLAPGVEFRMKYIAAALVVGALKWAFSGLKGMKEAVSNSAALVLSPVLAGLSLASAGLAVIYSGPHSVYDFVLLLSEVLIVAGSAFFFTRTLFVLREGNGLPSRQSDLCCMVITAGLAIVALSSFMVGPVSIGHVLAALTILVCAKQSGAAGGAISGITCGVAACMADTSYAFLMGSYGFGGILAGLFGRFGRFGCAAALVVVNGLAAALTALTRQVTLGPVLEVFAASVLFVLIPSQALKRFTPPAGSTIPADSLKGILMGRLGSTRKALGDVAAITGQVSEKLQKLDKPPFDINAAVADRICKKCPSRMDCWQEDFNGTSAALSDLTALVRQGHALTVEEIPEPLRHNCRNPKGILEALSSCVERQRRQESGFAKNMQLRAVVLDQWKGIERMISDISEDLSRIAVQDERTTGGIRRLLKQMGLEPVALSCYGDNGGRLVIELTLPPQKLRGIDRTELSFDLSEICERDFALPVRTDLEGGQALLTFTERTVYSVSSGVSQVCSTGKRLCGDSYKLMEDCGGEAMVILSDGMGCGSLAAIDSSMATSLISRLAQARVGLDATLQLVNSAMLIKSGDESLATVDICRVNLYDGKATFYKAGAAPSYLKKDGRVGYVESSSLPAGILDSVEFEQTSLQLSEEDIVVMVSDGVTQSGEDWMLDELERFKGKDMQQLSERLSSLAKVRRTPEHDDDITVCCLMLRRG